MTEDCNNDYYCCDYYTTQKVVDNDYIEEVHNTNSVNDNALFWLSYSSHTNNYYNINKKRTKYTANSNNDWVILFVTIFVTLAALIGLAAVL